MHINAHFARRAIVRPHEQRWTPSPLSGVDRVMLDRIGGEVARATSLVRYAPGSSFAAHTHGGGEEFLVLDGVFQDEHGDYPAGTYVRNPPTSSHTPRSGPGCTIFVKLWQFDVGDRTPVRVATHERPFAPEPGRAGVMTMPLYDSARESVRLERWRAGAKVTLAAAGGLEIVVLSGSIGVNEETFEAWSWLRFPDGDNIVGTGGVAGCDLWLKAGHLRDAQMFAGAATPLGPVP